MSDDTLASSRKPLDRPQREAEPRTEDFVFRFRLSKAGDESHDTTEMIRRQLAALLGVIVFTSEGVEVHIDGFKYLTKAVDEQHEEIYAIFPKSKPVSAEAKSDG